MPIGTQIVCIFLWAFGMVGWGMYFWEANKWAKSGMKKSTSTNLKKKSGILKAQTERLSADSGKSIKPTQKQSNKKKKPKNRP